jgi:mycothiol synthase
VTRPATPADAVAIRDLIAACEQDLFGRVDITADWVMAHLSHPGLALHRDSMLVHDDAGGPSVTATARWCTR